MELHGGGRLLRIYIGESDRYQHKPLYHEIVQAARREGLAGATVLRGFEGFGANSRIHTTRILSLSEDLPWWSRSWTPPTRSRRSWTSSTAC